MFPTVQHNQFNRSFEKADTVVTRMPLLLKHSTHRDYEMHKLLNV